MSIIKSSARLSHHTLTTDWTTDMPSFSVPDSEDFTDGSWSISDLALSEIGVNEFEGTAFIRIGQDIKQFNLINVNDPDLWIRTINGDIQAVAEPLLTSQNPAVLPFSDDVCDLGSSSLRWRDIYIGSKIDYSSVIDLVKSGQTYVMFNGHVTRFYDSNQNTLLDFNLDGTTPYITYGSRTGAAGYRSIVLGGNTGNENTASGLYAFASGFGTIASGESSTAIGVLTTASAKRAFASGNLTIASGQDSAAFGNTTTAAAPGAFVTGTNTEAKFPYSVAGGTYAKTNNSNEWARGSANNTQYGIVSFVRLTTNATTSEIFANGTLSAAGSEVYSIASGSVHRVKLTAIATNVSTLASIEFEGYGIIKNVAGTTSLVSAITMTPTVFDAAMSTCTMTVTADDTNDKLKIEVTGIAATNIGWLVKLDYLKFYP
mgnify:CR=1 FL=1